MLNGSSGIRLDLSPHPPSKLVLEMVEFMYRYEFPDAVGQVASNIGHLLGRDGIAESGMEFLFGKIMISAILRILDSLSLLPSGLFIFARMDDYSLMVDRYCSWLRLFQPSPLLIQCIHCLGIGIDSKPYPVPD